MPAEASRATVSIISLRVVTCTIPLCVSTASMIAGCRSPARRADGAAPGPSSAASRGDDDLLLDDEALDAADEEGAIGVEGPGFGRGHGALHGRAVVVPELGDAVDIHGGGGNVGPRALGDDVRLHVAPDPRYRVRQGGVNLQPVFHELLVSQAFLARQQPYALEHGRPSSGPRRGIEGPHSHSSAGAGRVSPGGGGCRGARRD